MKRHTIIGTAGHIDHGKTALIKALTGIDADRLKEEKDRGITIDIGFAYWRDDVTIIDVPGHEKFIRNMVAGVSTIDFFLLVIAADDGIMPQTIEHLDILKFFNITEGLVVLNKIDLVDQEWLELVTEEVKELLGKYGLSRLPIIPCSAHNGQNIDLLHQHIEEKISGLEEILSTRPFRLFVDRSFSIKGFGTVVTGTVLSGLLNKGNEVQLLPALRNLKVRGIQTHTADVEQVSAGFRAAINLHGVSKEDIIRGDVLCSPDTMAPVSEFTGIMQTVSKIPVEKIQNRSRVHVYAGTAECTGQLIWYESAKILQGNQTYHVRIKLDNTIAATRNDAFLVRLHSPVITLAGGKILEINPPKIRHSASEWQSYFSRMSTDVLQEIIESLIRQSGLQILSVQDIQKKLFEDEGTIKADIEELLKKKRIRTLAAKGKPNFIHESSFEELLNDILDYLKSYHYKMPHKPGINQQELINGMKRSWVAVEVFESALKKLLNSEKIRTEQNLIALSDFKLKMSKDTDETIDTVLHRIKETGFSPPTMDDLAKELEMPFDEIRSVFALLVKKGQLIAIQGQFYLHVDNWYRLVDFLKTYFEENSEMEVSALKEFIQTTRKYAIPLFEYLDSEGYTERAGDVRRRGYKL